jgi:two-component SAPR family response regulator
MDNVTQSKAAESDAERIESLEQECAGLKAMRVAEVEEFNEGFEAYKNGVRYDDLPDRPYDVIGSGYAWAAFDDLRRDAERYRWLRGNGAIISRDAEIPVHRACFGIGLDAAIDAAIAKATPISES